MRPYTVVVQRAGESPKAAVLGAVQPRPAKAQKIGLPSVLRPGWYHYRSAKPYDRYWAGLPMHLCMACARTRDTRLKPTDVEMHTLREHGLSLDAYVTEYGENHIPQWILSIAQWREP